MILRKALASGLTFLLVEASRVRQRGGLTVLKTHLRFEGVFKHSDWKQVSHFVPAIWAGWEILSGVKRLKVLFATRWVMHDAIKR